MSDDPAATCVACGAGVPRHFYLSVRPVFLVCPNFCLMASSTYHVMVTPSFVAAERMRSLNAGLNRSWINSFLSPLYVMTITAMICVMTMIAHRFRFYPTSDQEHSSNNGFWDRPAEERAARMEDACERNGIDNFFDLPAEERAKAYGDYDDS